MGTRREGGLKARDLVKATYGEDFYQRIGKIGGLAKRSPGGFAVNRELARIAGSKGGKISRRRGSVGGDRFKNNLPTIRRMLEEGKTAAEISRQIGMRQATYNYHLQKWLNSRKDEDHE